MSHLLQMRGLKLRWLLTNRRCWWSHLLQMRGLKQDILNIDEFDIEVASFTDAWIETLH